MNDNMDLHLLMTIRILVPYNDNRVNKNICSSNIELSELYSCICARCYSAVALRYSWEVQWIETSAQPE